MPTRLATDLLVEKTIKLEACTEASSGGDRPLSPSWNRVLIVACAQVLPCTTPGSRSGGCAGTSPVFAFVLNRNHLDGGQPLRIRILDAFRWLFP